MNEKASNRIVAIVGRPNVGKSAIFNRIARRRLSIVHDEEGVTRDRVSCEINWNDERFEMIDTGGIGYVDRKTQKDHIALGIQHQIDAGIEDAGVLIFVVDLMSGEHPLDTEVARLLHESGLPVLLVANKADTPVTDVKSAEFEAFGFPLFPVSALHNRGFDALMETVLKLLPEVEEPTKTEPLKVTIVGRPNAGKSSLINRIIGEERLIVTDIPGTTRDSVEIPFVVGSGNAARHYTLIDTAGLRKRSKLKTAVDKFALIRMQDSVENADVVLLVLDASEGPKGLDKHLAGLVEKNHKGAVILVNKWDLAQEQEITQRAYGEALLRELSWMTHVPILFGSAKSGYNIRQVLKAIDVVGGEISKTLSTGVLNRVLADAFEKHIPPMVGGRRFKVYYATQVSNRPITLKLFCNAPKLFTPSYERYLHNCLRTAFGLEGAPLLLKTVEKKANVYKPRSSETRPSGKIRKKKEALSARDKPRRSADPRSKKRGK